MITNWLTLITQSRDAIASKNEPIIYSLDLLLSNVSKYRRSASYEGHWLVMFHVYLVNVRNRRESFQTNAVVELGRRCFLAPIDIRSLRHSRGHERLKIITQNLHKIYRNFTINPCWNSLLFSESIQNLSKHFM